jgi:hypothetical protein
MRNSKLVATKVGIAASMLGMVVALSGITSGFAAGTSAPTAGDSPAGSASTSASVVVPPWCGWNIDPVLSSITLAPAAGAKYLGADLELTGSTSSVNAYVGGTSGATGELSADNCSWFGKTPLGASFGITIAEGDAKFTATSDDRADVDMGWLLSDKPLVIENTFSPGCSTAGFTPSAGASMATHGTQAAWSILSGSVGTNDFCSYSVNYTATIPGDKEPVYGDSTYVFAGPTLVHTLTTN